MARPVKRKVPGGTPASKRVTPSHSTRYTPPVPKDVKESPRWVPVVIFTLLGLGLLIILANYVGALLPGATSNWYLVLGLGFILAGIITATQWH